MNTFWRFIKGILLKGETSDPTDNAEGSLWYNSTTDRFKGYAESAVREVATTDQTQTLTNKTLSASTITNPVITVQDTNLTIQDNLDNTKLAKFQASGITTATTRTFTFPDETGTLTLNAGSQVLTNKTIDGDLNTITDLALTSLKTNLTDANKFLVRDNSGIVISNTKTVPGGDVVGTTDSQSLTNKILNNTNSIDVRDGNFFIQSSINTSRQVRFDATDVPNSTTITLTTPSTSGVITTNAATQTLQNKTLDNTNIVTVKDTNLTIQDDADTTKQGKFQASGITTATTRTYTLPDETGTLTLNAGSQVLTNKTISNANNTINGFSNNHAIISSGTGQLTSEAQLAITRGGTGQSTATAAFNALAPTTTKGDLITRDTSNNIRIPVGTNGQILTADSTLAAGIKWATPSSVPVTTKGDIFGYSTVPDRVPVGTNGQLLVADSTSATGLTWKSIGNVVSSTATVAVWPVASGVYGDLTSVTLTAGTWLISAVLYYDASGGPVNAGEIQLGINTVIAPTATGLIAGNNLVSRAPNVLATGESNNLVIADYFVTPGSTTTFYMKIIAGSNTNLRAAGRLTAARML